MKKNADIILLLMELSSMLEHAMQDYIAEHDLYVDDDTMYAELACMAKDEALAWVLEGKDLKAFIEQYPASDDCENALELAASVAANR